MKEDALRLLENSAGSDTLGGASMVTAYKQEAAV